MMQTTHHFLLLALLTGIGALVSLTLPPRAAPVKRSHDEPGER